MWAYWIQCTYSTNSYPVSCSIIRPSAVYCAMLEGTPIGVSPERWLCTRCSLSPNTSAWIQPWQGAMVLRDFVVASRWLATGIHGLISAVRSSGRSRSFWIRCGSWSKPGSTPSRSVVKFLNACPYEPGPRSPGSSPRGMHFSGVAHASHQSQPNSASSSSVRAPLMKAHSSPIALPANPLIERSVITAAPCSIGKRIEWPATASACSPCLVSTRTPFSRIRRSMSWYSELGRRSSNGRYRGIGRDKATCAAGLAIVTADGGNERHSQPPCQLRRAAGPVARRDGSDGLPPQGARVRRGTHVGLVRPHPPRPREVPRAGEGVLRRACRRGRQRREDPASQGRGPADGARGRAARDAGLPAPRRPDLPEGRRRAAL